MQNAAQMWSMVMSKIDEIQRELANLANKHSCKIAELENVLYANYLLHTPKDEWEGLMICQQQGAGWGTTYTFCIDKKRIEQCINGCAYDKLRQMIQNKDEKIEELTKTIEILCEDKKYGDEDD